MNNIKLDLTYTKDFITKDEIHSFSHEIQGHINSLTEKTGKGNDFLGWIDLPVELDEGFLTSIQKSADKLSSFSEVIVVIGIGGSYLGARAVIDALNHQFAS